MKIEYLADRPEMLVQVAAWCAAEWPWYYNDGDINTALSYHGTTLQKDSIPCGLVATSGDKLLGTISLIEEDMDCRSHYTPWLGCLYVSANSRDGRVVALLYEEAMRQAKRFGVPRLYSWTEKKRTRLLMHKGWELLEKVSYQGKNVELLVINLQPTGV